jgi:hypothetical protein
MVDKMLTTYPICGGLGFLCITKAGKVSLTLKYRNDATEFCKVYLKKMTQEKVNESIGKKIIKYELPRFVKGESSKSGERFAA